MTRSQFGRSFGIALIVVAGIKPSVAADAVQLTFMPHAAFFSSETHQPKPIDPQAFVGDAEAAAGSGPQNIQHAAGFRPALIDEDAKTTALFNASGEPLGFNLGHWLAAAGAATITPSSDGKAEISIEFTNLRPGGYYSLFENHFDRQPVGFTPLDGSGKDNNFIASQSGRAHVVLTAPQMLTHDNAVLLVYHSDKTFHGEQRGDIGVNAHHQLIARIPQ